MKQKYQKAHHVLSINHSLEITIITLNLERLAASSHPDGSRSKKKSALEASHELSVSVAMCTPSVTDNRPHAVSMLGQTVLSQILTGNPGWIHSQSHTTIMQTRMQLPLGCIQAVTDKKTHAAPLKNNTVAHSSAATSQESDTVVRHLVKPNTNNLSLSDLISCLFNPEKNICMFSGL